MVRQDYINGFNNKVDKINETSVVESFKFLLLNCEIVSVN